MKSVLRRQKRKNKSLLKENHFQVKACKIHTQKWAQWHQFINSTLTQKCDHQLFNIYVWLKSTKVIKTSADHNMFSCCVFKVLLFAWLKAQHKEQTRSFAGRCWTSERVQRTSLLTSRTHRCQPSRACLVQALRITKTLDARQVFIALLQRAIREEEMNEIKLEKRKNAKFNKPDSLYKRIAC